MQSAVLGNKKLDVCPKAGMGLVTAVANHAIIEHSAIKCHRQGHLEGLANGGIAAGTPWMHLLLTLDRCYTRSMDTTFGPGPLLNEEQNSDALEVWTIRLKAFEGIWLQAHLMRLSVNQSGSDSLRLLKTTVCGMFCSRWLDLVPVTKVYLLELCSSYQASH